MKIISSLTRNALVGFHRGGFAGTPGTIEIASQKEKKMDETVSLVTISRTEVIQALTVIRNEWENAAQGDSLTQIEGNVGYLLYDIAVALGLEERDLRLALGDLAEEI